MSNTVSTASLITGFNAARARFDTAAPKPELRDEAFQALFETVAWVGSLKDRLTQEKSPTSPELLGVYFVRNLVIHAGADALYRSALIATFGGAMFGAVPFGGGIDLGWKWSARTELPPHQSKTGLTEYDVHLVGTAPSETFAAIATHLAPLP